MALIHWPQEFGFFQYLRLKAFATCMRCLVNIVSCIPQRRHALIAHNDVRKERVGIPSRDPGRVILADIYYPPGYTSSAPTPVLVNWHGSGFVIPSHGSDMLLCTRVAHDVGAVVVDADYRKAPENPFPAAPNDVEDTLRWVAEQGAFDAKRVAVSGFSAGGCLALVAASILRKRLAHILDIRAVVALYPVADLAEAPEEKKVPNPKNALPAWVMKMFHNCYVPDETLRTNPLVSPIFADLDDFAPNAAIIACEGDTLMPEAAVLAEKLQNNGKQKVTFRVLEGVGHGFDKGAAEGSVQFTRRKEAYTLTVDVLKEAFGL